MGVKKNAFEKLTKEVIKLINNILFLAISRSWGVFNNDKND